MLEDFLKDIYDKAYTLELLKEVSFYSCVRHPYNSRDFWNEATCFLEKILEDMNATDSRKSSELLISAQKAQKCFDNLRAFASVIDNEMIPQMMDYLSSYTGIEVTENNWTLKSSQTGYLTLRRTNGKYVHSWHDPMWESFLYAYGIFKPEIRKYSILGGGLGYLAYQLWRMSDGEADIYVYEIDDEISIYSDLYGVMSLIDPDKLHYVTGENKDKILEDFIDESSDNKSVKTIYYWDEDRYDGEYADDIRYMLSNELTAKVFDSKWKSNYFWNTVKGFKCYSDLESNCFKDEWVVVASGPSLNDNECFIRESVGKRTICAVNSSLKWFSLHDIKPDYCTVCDPSDVLVEHIKGYESFSENVPLISDFIASRKYVELYKGPKYFVFSDVSSKLSDEKKREEDVWDFGGTVTSMALEAAFKSGAKKVYLVGADLGYPNGVTFAEGVGHDAEQLTEIGEKVVSVEGHLIPTTSIFAEYKYKIENQIENHPDIEVINKSLHGAYIRGCYCGKWWEDILETDESQTYRALFNKLNENSLILGWNEKYYIFQQLVYQIKTKGIVMSDDEELYIDSVYRGIYDSFVNKLEWSKLGEGKLSKSQTYIFVDEYNNFEDEKSGKVLDIALSEFRSGRTVLVVNTSEKMGGKKVPIHGYMDSKYNSDLEEKDTLTYKNIKIPYFQLPQGMPQIKSCSLFLDFISKNRPGKMIIIGKYSLLADCCADMMKIPVKRMIL